MKATAINALTPSPYEGLSRRKFLRMMGAAGIALAGYPLAVRPAAAGEAIRIKHAAPGEDLFAYIQRAKGKFDQTLYQQVIGAANDFKEGDLTIGVGARDDATRKTARELLANTTIQDLYAHPLFVDDLQKLIWQTTDRASYEKVNDWTMGERYRFNNLAFQQWFGVTPEEAASRTIREVIGERTYVKATLCLEEALAGRQAEIGVKP